MNTIQLHRNSDITFILLMIPTGAYCDHSHIKGVSHFVEHMCFKGTSNRTCEQINGEIERYGGNINAFTDWDVTCYYAEIINKHANKAKEILVDMVTNPTFPRKELEKERDVIIQEINMYEGDLDSQVEDLGAKQLYKKTCGKYLGIAGTRNTVKNIQRKDLINHYNKYHKNPLLIIIGDVENKIDCDTNLYTSVMNDFDIKKTPEEYYEENAEISQARLDMRGVFYNKSLSITENVVYLDLLSCLYNDMSGRLFAKIREEKGYVYRVNFGAEIHGNGAIDWRVSLGLNKLNIKKAYNLVMQELKRPVTKEELDFIKTKAIGQHAIYYSSNDALGTDIAYCVAQGIDWEDILINYSGYIEKISSNINALLEKTPFENGVPIGIIPE